MALAAFKGNIYQISNIYVPELSFPTTKKYLNLKGLSNNKFSCMRCHWHRMHDFCVRKSIISRRIRSKIQKGFSPWIRGPGGILWWKKNQTVSRNFRPSFFFYQNIRPGLLNINSNSRRYSNACTNKLLDYFESENHMQNSDGMEKNKKCMRCQWHRMNVCLNK
jgi:hypothetical protein